MPSSSKTLRFLYRFRFPNGQTKEFEIGLDRDTLALVSGTGPKPPDWTKLSYKQCTNCPLNEREHPDCPVAVNLSGVMEFFRTAASIETLEVEIVTEARTYKKQETLQQALGSLVGIIMVTSGCPVLDQLRPLVRTHLPFATLEETHYRVISMYLLAQYFLHQSGHEPDWTLQGLPKIYDEIQTVNRCFNERISGVQSGDAASNALVVLNCKADYTNILLSEADLNQIKKLFSAYLDPGPK